MLFFLISMYVIAKIILCMSVKNNQGDHQNTMSLKITPNQKNSFLVWFYKIC